MKYKISKSSMAKFEYWVNKVESEGVILVDTKRAFNPEGMALLAITLKSGLDVGIACDFYRIIPFLREGGKLFRVIE